MSSTDVRSIGVVHVAAGARNITFEITFTGKLGWALDLNEAGNAFCVLQ
jgi:hypothetical protein